MQAFCFPLRKVGLSGWLLVLRCAAGKERRKGELEGGGGKKKRHFAQKLHMYE